MASTRDLVVQVTADTSGLASGMAKGARSLADMEKQARQAERQIKKIGEAGASFQRLVNDFAGVTQAQNGAARASAEAFQEFARLEDAVNDLRGSLDPAYAATKRYEAGLQQLDTALAKGVISSDSHADSVRLLDDEFARATKSGGGMANTMRGVSQQLSQVGQQTMATGNFVQALAIQLPDIGLAFGAVGAAAGLLAGVALPMLMSAFGGGSEAADRLKEATQNADSAISAMHAAAQAATQPMADLAQKYGLAATEAQRFLATVAEAQSAAAMAAVQEQIAALAESFGNLYQEAGRGGGKITALAQEMGLTTAQAVALQQALDAMRNASGLDQQEAAAVRLHDELLKIYGSVEAMPPKMREFASATADAAQKALQFRNPLEKAADAMARLLGYEPGSDFLAFAIDRANALGQALSAAVAAKQKLASDFTVDASAGSPLGSIALPSPSAGEAPAAMINAGSWGGKGGGGGGGGKADAFAQQFEALQNSLKSQADLELEQYAKDQEALQLALDKKMVTLEQYHSSIEALQQAHQERMSEIDLWKYGTGLEQAQSFFGSMATALQGGNERMAKIAQKFAAVEALINAYRAGSQVLADPSLPFFAKIPAALSIIGAGMKMVSAIKGGGSSGGGAASAAASSATTAQQAPVQVNIAGFSTGQAIDGAALVRALKEIQSDRGIQII